MFPSDGRDLIGDSNINGEKYYNTEVAKRTPNKSTTTANLFPESAQAVGSRQRLRVIFLVLNDLPDPYRWSFILPVAHCVYDSSLEVPLNDAAFMRIAVCCLNR